MTDPATPTLKDYDLVEQIGQGAFGVIYRARQRLVGREVAIKVILPQYANQPDFIRRFETEAQLVARLEHLHIVPLYDYWRDPTGACLVMRLMRGGSLEKALERGPLSAAEVTRVLDQIGAALAAAHRQGVIHRDLKPANILLDEEGNAYLSDFGIAKAVGAEAETMATGAILGTPAYISPEQVQGGPITPQTDIYSLGVMLYEMLTGKHPFSGSSTGDLIVKHLTAPLPPLADVLPNLPAALDDVIRRATAKDPAARYPDAQALSADVGRILSREPAPGLAATGLMVATNPYKGLRAFREADADDFFGRESLTRRLIGRLGEQGESCRFLAVVGPSGSGKSSVVRAGLLPSLRHGALPGSEDWFFVDMLPGAHPLDELEIGLTRVNVNPGLNLGEQLRRDARGLLRAARMALPSDQDELLLFVDQFEEVFTLSGDRQEASHFLDLLYTAATDPGSRVRVVIALRADFYDRPLMVPDFSTLLQRRTEVVLPLTAEELGRAIRGPAERVGLALEAGLEARMVADVLEQPGGLPLLQYALTELFERRAGRQLTAAAYESIGGVLGALGRRAEEIYAALDPAAQSTSRQLFLRLVTLGEGTEDTRRRVLRAELESLGGQPALVDQALTLFGRARLLSFDRDALTRGATVEIAHEALLREWRRLHEWLDESRGEVRLQRALAHAAVEWRTAGRDPSFLLGGSRLQQFEEWAASTTVALTDDERAYLHASLAAREVQEAEETARRERELETARRLAEAERRRAEEHARAAARLRRRAFSLAVALVVAAVLAAAAGILGRRYWAESNRATARELAFAALNDVDVDPERSIMLSLQASSTWSSLGEPVPYDLQETLHRAVAGSRAELTWSSAGDFILYVDFDPADGRPRAVAGNPRTGAINAWNLRDNRALLSVHGPVSRLTRVSFSPDGQYLAAPSDGRKVTLWSVRSGQPWRSLSGFSDDALGAIFSPDGKALATFSAKEQIVWDVASGKRLIQVAAPPGDRIAVAFSPDGQLVAAVTAVHTVKVFEVTTGRETATLSATFDVTVIAMGPAPRGQAGGMRLVGAGRATTAIVWDVPAARAVLTVPVAARGGQANLVAFSPDATRLLVDTDLYDATTGAPLFSLLGQTGVLHRADFSTDGTHLITGGVYDTVRVWDLGASHERLTIVASAPVAGVALNPDGKVVASADGNRALLTDLSSGQRLHTLDGHSDSVTCLAFSPDGKLLATGGADRTVRLWDTASGQAMRTLTGHQADRPGVPPPFRGVHAVAFSSACARERCPVAAIGLDGQLIVWDARSGQALWTHQDPLGALKSLAYSPDGTMLAVGSTGDLSSPSATATIFDAATGKVRRRLSGPAAWLWGLAFSPDGKRLAAVFFAAGGTIWDVTTGREVVSLQRMGNMTGAFMAVAFSPDGTLLATGNGDGRVQLWDARSGIPLFSLAGHAGPAFAVSMSADGRLLASASMDGTTRVYTLRVEDLLTLARQRLTRGLTADECRKYLHRETCP